MVGGSVSSVMSVVMMVWMSSLDSAIRSPRAVAAAHPPRRARAAGGAAALRVRAPRSRSPPPPRATLRAAARPWFAPVPPAAPRAFSPRLFLPAAAVPVPCFAARISPPAHAAAAAALDARPALPVPFYHRAPLLPPPRAAARCCPAYTFLLPHGLYVPARRGCRAYHLLLPAAAGCCVRARPPRRAPRATRVPPPRRRRAVPAHLPCCRHVPDVCCCRPSISYLYTMVGHIPVRPAFLYRPWFLPGLRPTLYDTYSIPRAFLLLRSCPHTCCTTTCPALFTPPFLPHSAIFCSCLPPCWFRIVPTLHPVAVPPLPVPVYVPFGLWQRGGPDIYSGRISWRSLKLTLFGYR